MLDMQRGIGSAACAGSLHIPGALERGQRAKLGVTRLHRLTWAFLRLLCAAAWRQTCRHNDRYIVTRFPNFLAPYLTSQAAACAFDPPALLAPLFFITLPTGTGCALQGLSTSCCQTVDVVYNALWSAGNFE